MKGFVHKMIHYSECYKPTKEKLDTIKRQFCSDPEPAKYIPYSMFYKSKRKSPITDCVVSISK